VRTRTLQNPLLLEALAPREATRRGAHAARVLRNPKLHEALKPDRQKQAAPNINVMRFRCDEPKAKLRHVFFMRQELAFPRRMRDGERCCGRHG
jgi:hypothetical protein